MSKSVENSREAGADEEEYLRKIARKKVLGRLGFQIHLTAYIFVNILLFLINILTNPNYIWSLWGIIGWGVGISFHSFAFYVKKPNSIKWHAFSFLMVNLALIFIFFFTNSSTYPWYLWPLGGWSLGLLTHFMIFLIRKPRKGEDSSKSWIERKIDNELQKVIPIIVPKVENERKCPQCRAIIYDNSQFCPSCGTQINL